MGGKVIKSKNRGYTKSQTKQQLINIAFFKDTDYLTSYIQRHRDNIDELLPWYSYSETALHLVVNKGWMEGVEALMKAGAEVNLFDTDYSYSYDKHVRPCHQPFETDHRATYTPLMRAATSTSLFDIAQYLLAHGADPNLKCPYTGESAVSVAIKHFNVDLVQLLIEKYNVQFDPTKALHNLTNTQIWLNMNNRHETIELIKFLLKNRASLAMTITNYMLSPSNISFKTLDFFISQGYNIESLCECYIRVNMKCPANYIRWFLRHGMDTHAYLVQTRLHEALETNDYETTTLLCHADACCHSIAKKYFNNTFMMSPWMRHQNYCLHCLELLYFKGQPPYLDCNPQHPHLYKFTDESIDFYTEEMEPTKAEKDKQLNRLTTLLSQPLTLKVQCRHYLRRSPCGPTPKVLWTLPIPPALKRYILCHEL